MSAKLVSVIGPVAVGKTTLARYLADELSAEVIYEDYDGNPFLVESYNGVKKLALPSQLYFLMSRVKQLSELTWPAEGLVVTDYGFCQDRMFAEAKLAADELLFYEHLCRQIECMVHPPDVLVHLDAPAETLMARIAGRGRAYESGMTVEFLARMREAHDKAKAPVGCRMMKVDCESVDLRQAGPRAELIQQIREAL
jgi:deoxyadenosine/deoxycytidine kinase